MTCRWLAAIVALLVGASGCDQAEVDRRADRPIRALCTTGMVGDLVKRVGGEHVSVELLMKEGVDPHLYKASAGDVARLIAADAVFYSGLHLEGKLDEVFEPLARRKPTVAVTRDIPRDQLIMIEDAADPHVWLDVALWARGLPVVAETLAAMDPPNATKYQEAARTAARELAELDRWCRETLATIPPEKRILVTAHDAFGYFSRAYGLEVQSIQGINTEAEASVRQINELVAFLTAKRIGAVFVESSVNPRNIQALIEGCAAHGHRVAIGGELFSDAMGPAGTPEGTYAGMIRHNVLTITRGLRGGIEP